MTTLSSREVAGVGGDLELESPHFRSLTVRLALPAVAAAATYALFASGHVPGVVSLLALALALVLVPTAANLARRLGLNGALLLGWLPVAWWVRWPFGIDHAATLLAVAAGVLTGCLLARRRVAVLPVVSPSHLLLVLPAVLPFLACGPWVLARTPRAALLALLPGADNASHFFMFSALRQQGAMTQALPVSPDGTRYAFDVYPQGFHAVVATVAELLHPAVVSGPQLLPAYTQSVVVTLALALVSAVAALLSLPALRRRASVALPLVVLVCTAYLWKPGQNVIADGFANFWLGSLVAGMALVVSLDQPTRLSRRTSAAVAGLVMATTYLWAPLVLLAAPTGLALWFPLRDLRSVPRGRVWFAVVVLLLGALGSVRALAALFHDVAVSTLVAAWGGVHGPQAAPNLALLVLALTIAPMAPVLLRSQSDLQLGCFASRARALVLVPLIGLTLTVLLLQAQVQAVGTSSYYLLKFVLGMGLVLVLLVSAVLGVLGAALLPRVGPRALVVVVSLLVAGLTAQSFGRFPSSPVPMFDLRKDSTAFVVAPYSIQDMADGILSAASVADGPGAFDRDYVAIGKARAPQIFYPNFFFHGITVSLTDAGSARMGMQRSGSVTPEQTVGTIRQVLERYPDLKVIVAPAYLDRVRKLLAVKSLGDRVTTWQVAGP